MKPPPGSSRPALEVEPVPQHRVFQTLEQGKQGPDLTFERWQVLLDSGKYTVAQLEARIDQDLPVTSRPIARLLLELFADELEPG